MSQRVLQRPKIVFLLNLHAVLEGLLVVHAVREVVALSGQHVLVEYQHSSLVEHTYLVKYPVHLYSKKPIKETNALTIKLITITEEVLLITSLDIREVISACLVSRHIKQRIPSLQKLFL
jgi:hypothetical protein